MKNKFTKYLAIIILVSLIYTLKAQTNSNSAVPNIKTTSPNATSLQTSKVQEQSSRLTISTGHNGAVMHLIISPDSTYLLSGGQDGCIKIWDIEAGALINTISGLRINKKNFDITPDGKYVVAISNSYRLVIIDIHSSKVLKAFSYTNDVNYLKIIDNGTKIICGSKDYSTKIYDLKSGKQIAEVSIAPGVNDYTKTENSSLVLTRGMYYETYSKLVDLKNNQLVYQISKEYNNCAFSDDNKKIITANNHGEIELRNLTDSSVIYKYRPHYSDITSMRLLLNGYVFSCSTDGTAVLQSIWNKMMRFSRGISIDQSYICEGPNLDNAIWSGLVVDSNKIFLGYADGSIKLWTPFTHNSEKIFAKMKCPVYKASVINDSLKLHIKGAIWSAKTENMTNCSIKKIPEKDISFLDDKMEYYASFNENYSSGEIYNIYEGLSYGVHTRPFAPLIKSFKKLLLIYDSNLGVALHDFAKKELKWKLPMVDTRISNEITISPDSLYFLIMNNINSITFSENGEYIAYTGSQYSNTNIIEIRDVEKGDIKWSKQGIYLKDIAFIKNDSVIYGNNGNGIIFYSFPEFNKLQFIYALNNQFTSHAISTDFKKLATLDYDGQIVVYDLKKKGTKKYVGKLTTGLFQVMKFVSNNNVLLTIDENNVKFWSVNNSKLIGELCFIDKDNWVFYTPDNRFEATKDAIQYVNLIFDGKIVKDRSYLKNLYTPGLLYKRIGKL